MITTVDTNVLVDVFRNDPAFASESSEALRRCIAEGRLVVCDVVWAELAALFDSAEPMAKNMEILGVDYVSIEREAAALAGTTWRRYRERGGTRDRVVADFLVAAHAMIQCDRLLTRDRGFYRESFDALRILDPTSAE
ncbi:MAG: type II toxin-antitoxin system VapC family toxin [Deltaproteobacteria bacterium]|nr:type II toxin-antitoxin system VapC family toxin [Deltaproteobacteria bacterium]